MNDKIELNDLVLIVRLESEHGFSHLIGVPAELDTTKRSGGEFCCEQGEVSWGHAFTYLYERKALDHLRVHSQANDSDEKRYFYGAEFRYSDLYAVDGSDARRMAKTLTTLERKMDRMDKQLGRPASTAEFIFRAAKALGCKWIAIKKTKEAFQRSGYGYRLHKVDGEALESIRRIEREYCERAT